MQGKSKDQEPIEHEVKMKDALKKHIQKNRREFEIYQNDFDLLWPTISSKLDRERKSGNKVFRNLLKIAATVIIIISVGFAYYLGKRSVEYNREGIALHHISNELAETEAYYIGLINDQMEYLTKSEPQIENEIWESLHQMDSEYEQLKKDLTDQADSEEVINAMISYYRLKLNMLEKMSDELQEKPIENENTIL